MGNFFAKRCKKCHISNQIGHIDFERRNCRIHNYCSQGYCVDCQNNKGNCYHKFDSEVCCTL